MNETPLEDMPLFASLDCQTPFIIYPFSASFMWERGKGYCETCSSVPVVSRNNSVYVNHTARQLKQQLTAPFSSELFLRSNICSENRLPGNGFRNSFSAAGSNPPPCRFTTSITSLLARPLASCENSGVRYVGGEYLAILPSVTVKGAK